MGFGMIRFELLRIAWIDSVKKVDSDVARIDWLGFNFFGLYGLTRFEKLI